jgi:hypothetical protein
VLSDERDRADEDAAVVIDGDNDNPAGFWAAKASAKAKPITAGEGVPGLVQHHVVVVVSTHDDDRSDGREPAQGVDRQRLVVGPWTCVVEEVARVDDGVGGVVLGDLDNAVDSDLVVGAPGLGAELDAQVPVAGVEEAKGARLASAVTFK